MANTVKVVLEGEDADLARKMAKQDESIRKLQGQLKNVREEGKRGSQEIGGMLGQQVEQLRNMALGYVGIQAVIGAVRSAHQAWQQDMEQSVRTIRQFQDSFTDLMFIGDVAKAPELRERMLGLSRTTGIPAPEISAGFYGLKSYTAGLPEAQQEAILREALEFRQTTSLPLQDILRLYGKTAVLGKGEGLEANEIQNIIKRTIDEAASTPGAIATQWPKALGAGLRAGMTTRESAAMLAYVTGQTSEEEAGSAMDAFLRKLMAPGTIAEPFAKPIRGRRMTQEEESRQAWSLIWQQAGIRPKMGAMERLRRLAPFAEAGDISGTMLQGLFQEQGVRAAGLLTGFPEFTGRVEAFKSATGADVDLVGAGLSEAYRDEMFRNIQGIKRAEAGVAATRMQPAALEWELGRATLEEVGRESNWHAYLTWLRKREYEISTFLGADPETAMHLILGDTEGGVWGGRLGGPTPELQRARELFYERSGRGLNPSVSNQMPASRVRVTVEPEPDPQRTRTLGLE